MMSVVSRDADVLEAGREGSSRYLSGRSSSRSTRGPAIEFSPESSATLLPLPRADLLGESAGNGSSNDHSRGKLSAATMVITLSPPPRGAARSELFGAANSASQLDIIASKKWATSSDWPPFVDGKSPRRLTWTDLIKSKRAARITLTAFARSPSAESNAAGLCTQQYRLCEQLEDRKCCRLWFVTDQPDYARLDAPYAPHRNDAITPPPISGRRDGRVHIARNMASRVHSTHAIQTWDVTKGSAVSRPINDAAASGSSDRTAWLTKPRQVVVGGYQFATPLLANSNG